jgi:hypothetical protein
MSLRITRWVCLLLAFVCISCSSQQSVPSKPDSVPDNALWIGGADGGAWILISKPEDQADHIYHAEIYGDQAGEPWYIGLLELSNRTNTNVPLNDPEVFGIWDGDALSLKDGRIMQSIEEFDPFKKEN